MLEYKAAKPPLEKPITAIREGSTRGWWMLGEYFECLVTVYDHGKARQLRLVGDRLRDAAAGKRIQNEGSDAYRV